MALLLKYGVNIMEIPKSKNCRTLYLATYPREHLASIVSEYPTGESNIPPKGTRPIFSNHPWERLFCCRQIRMKTSEDRILRIFESSSSESCFSSLSVIKGYVGLAFLGLALLCFTLFFSTAFVENVCFQQEFDIFFLLLVSRNFHQSDMYNVSQLVNCCCFFFVFSFLPVVERKHERRYTL